MMSETIDDALDDDEAEEESEELTNQVSLLFCLDDSEDEWCKNSYKCCKKCL